MQNILLAVLSMLNLFVLQWTAENPEGLDDYRSLGQVIKIKKHLNCPKCGKQINFHQYYKQHTEWCGRDVSTGFMPYLQIRHFF